MKAREFWISDAFNESYDDLEEEQIKEHGPYIKVTINKLIRNGPYVGDEINQLITAAEAALDKMKGET